MRNSTRNSVKNYFLEGLFILISVLLAFGLNEWRENRANRALAQVALNNCIREMESNLATLEHVYPLHSEVYAQLQEIAGRDEQPTSITAVLQEIMPAQGLQLPSLETVAWQTATTTAAFGHLDYETATLLSHTYLIQQSGIPNTVERFQNSFFTHRSFSVEGVQETLTLLQMLASELASQEQYMIDVYRTNLSKLRALEGDE